MVSGEYADSNNALHGFVRAADGTIKAFDPPGSVNTIPAGIDSERGDKGAIVGYFAKDNVIHGFLRTR